MKSCLSPDHPLLRADCCYIRSRALSWVFHFLSHETIRRYRPSEIIIGDKALHFIIIFRSTNSVVALSFAPSLSSIVNEITVSGAEMAKIYAELSEKDSQSKELVRKKFLNFLDSLISFFVVSPLVVGFWYGKLRCIPLWSIFNVFPYLTDTESWINRRGTWNNIIAYDDLYGIFPLWECLALSLTVVVCINFFRSDLNRIVIEDHRTVKSRAKTAKRILIVRIYHYFSAFACIMVWRCMWEVVPRLWGEFEAV